MQRVIDTRHRLADDPWQVHPTGAPIPAAGDWLFDLADWRSGAVGAALATGRRGRNGLALAPDADLDTVAPVLADCALVAVHFPAATDGRGLSVAMVLRRRLGWHGPMRALGPLWRDQLFALRRLGFDSFELRETEDPEQALAAFATFSDAYQASVDGLAPLVLRKLALLDDSAERTP